jgi:hypothetical protein
MFNDQSLASRDFALACAGAATEQTTYCVRVNGCFSGSTPSAVLATEIEIANPQMIANAFLYTRLSFMGSLA